MYIFTRCSYHLTFTLPVILDIDPVLSRCAGIFRLDLFFCRCLMFNMFLETEVCSVEVVNLDEDAMECMSSVSSYNEDSTSEDNIDEVSVVVVAPIGLRPRVEAEPPAPVGTGIPGPGSLGGRLLRRCPLGPSPRSRLAALARAAASLLLRAIAI